MVNKPLIRPYFWGGYIGGGGWLTSHDSDLPCNLYNLFGMVSLRDKKNEIGCNGDQPNDRG